MKVAARLVGADVAQAAFQEAALKAWLSLDRLAKPESFGAWLTGIAIDVCKTWLRAPHTDLSWEVLSGGAFGGQRHESWANTRRADGRRSSPLPRLN